jgi:hypothetical protein
MYIVQCYYSEAGEDRCWHDLNAWVELKHARNDFKDCKKSYKKSKYKWRIVQRIVIHKITEKVVK